MRKNSWIHFAVFFLVLFGVTNVALSKEEMKSQKELIASGHPEWPPVMFQKGKNIIGVGPDLARKIFGDLGLKVKIPYSGSWEETLSQGKAGLIDVVVAAYKTKEREEFFIYSDSYTTDPVVVFVPADKTFKFTKLSDLHDKSGIGMLGDSYGQKFDDYSATHLNLLRVQTASEAFDKITKHTADYFIYSLYAGKLEIKKNKLSNIVPLPHLVSEQKFYMMISKQSPFARYLPDVNRLIKQYQEDGTIARFIAEHE